MTKFATTYSVIPQVGSRFANRTSSMVRSLGTPLQHVCWFLARPEESEDVLNTRSPAGISLSLSAGRSREDRPRAAQRGRSRRRLPEVRAVSLPAHVGTDAIYGFKACVAMEATARRIAGPVLVDQVEQTPSALLCACEYLCPVPQQCHDAVEIGDPGVFFELGCDRRS